MNIEVHRKSIIHRILDVQNETLLEKIDQLLNEEGYLFDVSGKKLSIYAYKQEVEEILKVSEGNELYTSTKIRERLLKR